MRFKKLLVIGFVILSMFTIIACGNTSKTFTKDDIIKVFKDKGIEVENVEDAMDASGGAGGITEAVSFTSGDIGGTIIVMENAESVEAFKQSDDLDIPDIKNIYHNNVVITLINMSENEVGDEEFQKFEDALS